MSSEQTTRREALKRITATAGVVTLGTAAQSQSASAASQNEVRVEPFNAASEKNYRLIFGQYDTISWESLESDDNWEFPSAGNAALDGTIASSGDDVDVIYYDQANFQVDESETDCCVKVTLNGEQLYP